MFSRDRHLLIASLEKQWLIFRPKGQETLYQEKLNAAALPLFSSSLGSAWRNDGRSRRLAE